MQTEFDIPIPQKSGGDEVKEWFSVGGSHSAGFHSVLWRCRLASGGQEGKLSGLFCAVLCATIVHSELHTHMNRTNSSLVWVLSHWGVTGPISLCLDSFLCMYEWFCVWLYIACMCSSNMVRCTWWDWSLILRTTTSFSALTLLVGSFDP